jgi:hypothetical protein
VGVANVLYNVYISGVQYANLALYNHVHNIYPASEFLNAVNASHHHPLPTHTTENAAAQSHVGALDPAQTRAGSAAHPEESMTNDNQRLDYLLNHLPTGHSVHYLTLGVKVNGVEVTGSPFSGDNGTGLYVGDSLGPLDISSLVTVGIKNSIAVTLTEWGGAGPVKCSVSGNVNVNAIISAF